jgi:hypothetical protein
LLYTSFQEFGYQLLVYAASGVPCKHSNRTALAIVFAIDQIALIFAIATEGAGGRSGVHCKHSNRTAPTQSARKIGMLLILASWTGEAIVLANVAVYVRPLTVSRVVRKKATQ